ncbi:MAG: hypothetical protein JEZ11_26465 [Desulfobacterales bacterium]|nr:hypothetical protein [Desulfobacterales bacterium]
MNLSALIKGLNEAGVAFVVVGGIAAVAQGAPVTTFDLDIVHRQTEDNVEKLMGFLKSIDAYARRPDDIILKPVMEDLKEKSHVLLSTNLGPLDVLAFIEKGLGFDELIDDCIQIEFHGHTVYALNLEKMVELKRESSAPKDRHRLEILEETLRASERWDNKG